MTFETFRDYFYMQKPFEFCYKNKTYRISFEKENSNIVILLGERFSTPEKYSNMDSLLYEAFLEGHYFKDILPEIKIV